MISNRPLLLATALLVLSGCATLSVESPICVPIRPVLVDLSVADQLAIREQVSSDALDTISTNDLELKSHVRLLEGLIEAHDSPLGSCD